LSKVEKVWNTITSRRITGITGKVGGELALAAMVHAQALTDAFTGATAVFTLDTDPNYMYIHIV
jgi:hypothetical protein